MAEPSGMVGEAEPAPVAAQTWEPTLLDLAASRHAANLRTFFSTTIRPVCEEIAARLSSLRAEGRAEELHELRTTQIVSHQSFATMIGALWERGFKEHLLDVVRSSLKGPEREADRIRLRKLINSGSWQKFEAAFLELRGFPLNQIPMYRTLYILHLVCSTVRHGEGVSSGKLLQEEPRLFMKEAELRDIWDYFLESVAPDSVSKLDITLADLEAFAAAVEEFWEMIGNRGFGTTPP